MKDKPIHRAVIDADIELVNKYIGKGIDIDIQGENNSTPLHYACQNGNLQIVKLLLKNGADTNIKSNYSTFYPIFDILTSKNDKNCYEIIKLLIEADADINRVDSFGNTTLHHAVEKESMELIELLLSLNCDVNQTQRYDKDTALHYACFQKNKKIANRLIEAGADANRLNLYNKRAISYL